MSKVKNEFRKLISYNIKEIDKFNMDITELQLKINKLAKKNNNRYFLMCSDVKIPYENYSEGAFVAASGYITEKYTEEKLQTVLRNTTKTLEKFILLKELAEEKLIMLQNQYTGGKSCG